MQDNEFFNLKRSQEFWDSAADGFSRRIADNTNVAFNKDTDRLIAFLQQRSILTAESGVLDIGCGPGRFTREFAKISNHVTAIDISSNMIQHAKQNTAEEHRNHVDYETADWKLLDLAARGWQKKFDLVFASMTPGISDINTLIKMCDACKGYCFMSGFITRKDDVADQLRSVIMSEDIKSRGKHLYYAINILFLAGYYPEIRYHDIENEHAFTLEQAIKTYSAELKIEKQDDQELTERISDYLKNVVSNDGMITEKRRAKIAWILWKA